LGALFIESNAAIELMFRAPLFCVRTQLFVCCCAVVGCENAKCTWMPAGAVM
jgi:hypothetical protein